MAKITDILDKASKTLKLQELGEINTFLGIQITRQTGTIALKQGKYIDNLLERFSKKTIRPSKTPYTIGLKLRKSASTAEKEAILLY